MNCQRQILLFRFFFLPNLHNAGAAPSEWQLARQQETGSRITFRSRRNLRAGRSRRAALAAGPALSPELGQHTDLSLMTLCSPI